MSLSDADLDVTKGLYERLLSELSDMEVRLQKGHTNAARLMCGSLVFAASAYIGSCLADDVFEDDKKDGDVEDQVELVAGWMRLFGEHVAKSLQHRVEHKRDVDKDVPPPLDDAGEIDFSGFDTPVFARQGLR